MPKKKQPESRKQDDPNVMGLRADRVVRPYRGFGKSALPGKFRTQSVFTAAIQRQLLSILVYRNRRRIP